MDNILGILVTQILHGGPEVVAMLAIIIGLLLWDRKRLNSEISRKDERLSKIVDEYYKGNISLAEALSSLKAVLYEMKSRM